MEHEGKVPEKYSREDILLKEDFMLFLTGKSQKNRGFKPQRHYTRIVRKILYKKKIQKDSAIG